MGGIGSVGVWFRGWRESNFGISRVDRVGPQNFGRIKKKSMGRSFGVGEKYDFTNFCYDSMKFYL